MSFRWDTPRARPETDPATARPLKLLHLPAPDLVEVDVRDTSWPSERHSTREAVRRSLVATASERNALRSLLARLVSSLDGSTPVFFQGVELDELECQLIREAITGRTEGEPSHGF